MRIAFVASLSAPARDVTSRGDHIVLADLARAFVERGHEVMVFGAEGSYLKGLNTAPVSGGYAQVAWHVEQWEADVIANHASEAGAFGMAPEVTTVHVLHANPTADLVRAARSVHGPLVTVSHDSEQRWRAAGLTNARAVPNGVPDLAFSPDAPDAIAIVAGRICAEKGTAAALRAARRAGLQPVLVGDIADRAYFAREVVPLLDGVHVFRTLPRERLWALMGRAAVTLAPADCDEAFGLVAAESQLAGCPVVAYARGALSEVIAHGNGGVLVTPGDEDALVEAVPLARSLDRVAVRESARDRFDADVMVDAHEELLAEAATGMARNRAA